MRRLSVFACAPLLLGALLLAHADEPSGFLGLRVRSVPQGARVVEVMPGSPAEAAGLSEGDLIVQAGESPLGGLSTREITSHLRGPIGTEITLAVVPFPGSGAPTRLQVGRGPAIGRGSEKKGSFFPEEERAANLVVAGLRGERAPDLAPSLQTWSESKDAALADLAFIRMLREASSLWWAQEPPVPDGRAAAFWAALAADPTLQSFVRGRRAETRLAASIWLARHSASAELALSLLGALPPELANTSDARSARALAQATRTRDVAKVAALRQPTVDVVTLDDLSFGAGALGSDLAALELAAELGGRAGARDLLPPEVITRLEMSAGVLPWALPPDRGAPFGALPPAPAPPLKVEKVGGGELDLSARTGGLTLVSFWATWCGPCRQEMPRLQELEKELASTGLEVWGISLDDERDKVEPFLKEQGITFAAGYGSGAVRDLWGVGPIPRLFVLDASGRIAIDHTGYSESSFEHLSREVRGLAKGEITSERRLGRMLEGQAELVAVGPASTPPTALFTDSSGDVWIADEDNARRLVLQQGRLTPDDSEVVPLAFPAELLRWVDLDGDHTEELVSADAGGRVVRVSRRDGEVVWSHRSLDTIGGVALSRHSGALAPAVLRIHQEEIEDPRATPQPGGPRPTVLRSTPRIDLFDARGGLVRSVPLTGEVTSFSDDDAGQLTWTLADGSAWILAAAGEPQRVGPEWQRLRTSTFTQPGGQVLLGSGASHTLLPLRGAQGSTLAVVTGGGDISFLSRGGQITARLDLQRRPRIAVGDLDRDGQPELVLYAHWFGLAAVEPLPPPPPGKRAPTLPLP